MAAITMRLREVIDSGFTLPLDDYPIHDEEHRKTLNDKIVAHYMMDEIGYETIDLFLYNLRRKMHEIMPYYVQLYKSELIKFDPLQTVKITENVQNEQESTGTNNVNTNTTGTNTSSNSNDSVASSRVVTSETPQTRLSGSEDYASGATDSGGTTHAEGASTGASEGTEATSATTGGSTSATMGRTLEGSQGPASELLTRYRETILNIDMNIIQDLQELFMSVWDTGDDYTESRFGYGYWPYWFAL